MEHNKQKHIDTYNQTNSRILGIDQARALAIGAMILAHFAPFVTERIDPHGTWSLGVLALGRFATPAFVFVFGIAVGLAYLPKLTDDANPSGLYRRILSRGLLLVVCVPLVRLEGILKIFGGNTELTHIPFVLYSIIAFYAIAVFLLPLILSVVRYRPMLSCLLLGSSLWLLHGYLAFRAWPQQGTLNLLEAFRLYLVSGPYALLPMLGTAILAMPLGLFLRRCPHIKRSALWVKIGVCGILLVTMGLCGGALLGEIGQYPFFLAEHKAPPRIWFFSVFVGLTMLAMWYLEVMNEHMASKGRNAFPLFFASAGQSALVVYVAHALAFPLATGLGHVFPRLGNAAPAIAFIAFLILALTITLRSYRRQTRISRRGTPVQAALGVAGIPSHSEVHPR